jgi:hypothetical protein
VTHPRFNNRFESEILPADGIGLPKIDIGDFGRSPIFGQLSVKTNLPDHLSAYGSSDRNKRSKGNKSERKNLDAFTARVEIGRI